MAVFVVQNTLKRDPASGQLVPKHDGLDRAGEYGDLLYLLGPSAAPWGETVVDELEEKLGQFCDSDFLLLIGNPTLIGLAFAIAADANEGRVTTLQWDGREGRYRPVRCVIPSWADDAED